MADKLNLMYNIVSNIQVAGLQAVASLCLMKFCRNYTEKKNLMWIVGCVYFALSYALYYVPFMAGNFTAYFLSLIASWVVYIWIDKNKIRMKIFLAAVFFVMRWVAYSTVGRIGFSVSALVYGIMDNTVDYSKPDFWKYYFAMFVIKSAFDVGLCGTILYLLVKIINRVLIYNQADFKLQELLFMMIPPVNGMVVYGIFVVYAVLYRNETYDVFYRANLPVDMLWIVCYAIIFISIVGAITLYQNIRQRNEEESTALMTEGRIRDMQSHIAEVEKLYADIRGIRHDISNHMEIINSLIAQGKTDEALKYSDSLSETVNVYDFAVGTGNPVTDVIIREKKGLAAEHNIEFVSDYHYPENGNINAFDISIILSNALSNSLEAAGEGGFVKVSSFRNKNAYLIKVENSFDGKLEFGGGNSLPLTQKGEGIHGFGLKNIRSVADKYYGDMKIEQKEGRVVLTVMLLDTV